MHLEQLERRDLLAATDLWEPTEAADISIVGASSTSQAIGNMDMASAPEATPATILAGFRGDIVKVDLVELFGGATFSLPTLLDPLAADLILPESVGEQPYSSAGFFYVAPKAPGAFPVETVMDVDGVPQAVRISINSGLSQVGANAVTFGNSTLEIIRLQQRLRGLGYPGPAGQPLTLTGQYDGPTVHSIGLFNAAMTGGPLIPSSHVRRDFINEIDTPKWVELDPTAINAASDGLYLSPNLSDGSAQSDRYASEMLLRLIESSQNHPVQQLADDGQPATLIAQQPRLEIRTLSGPAGGSLDATSDHHAGLQIDVETPATNGPQT